MEKIGIAAGTEKFSVFSEKIINDFADKNFSKAKKYYCLKDKTRFKEFLETASSFNSDIKNIKVKAE